MFAECGGRTSPRSESTSRYLHASLPVFVVAIDGSWAEVDVRNGYPGAKVGYCTVASVLLDLLKIEQLDASRPVDPREFRKTEEASTFDAAMPGCNWLREHTLPSIDSLEKLYMKTSMM